MESFVTAEQRQIQEAWLDEAERRLADYEAGRAESIPYDEVMRKLREKLGTKSRLPPKS